MISSFAKIQQIYQFFFLLTFFFFRGKDKIVFFYFPTLFSHYLRNFTNLENIWKIQKWKKNHPYSLHSILVWPFHSFFSKLFLCSPNYKVYSFSQFYTAVRKKTERKVLAFFKYLKGCHVKEMTDLFCANSRDQ